jgi:glycosyltransferase involved in cell wall biosynthesis
MIEEALEVGIDKARLGWMPNPVDTDVFYSCTSSEREQRRQELNIASETPLVVFVGRLDTQKELPWLLGAFQRVVAARPCATLVLVGDGPLRGQIVQMAHDLELDGNLILAGRLDAGGVLKWLHVSDVFTMVSAVEGLPCLD